MSAPKSLVEFRRRLRFGHVQTGGEPWFLGVSWSLWKGDRHVDVYLWRLLFTLRLPGMHRRKSGDLWRRWTAGDLEVTWFDKARAE